MTTYALRVHKISVATVRKAARRRPRPRLVVEAQPIIRRAQLVDVLQVCALVNGYAAEKLMLPRTNQQIALELDNYVVAVTDGGQVLACAAIDEYSPSVAEIASVAVDHTRHGRGLGSQVVRAAEVVAGRRGYSTIFAMSLADKFFTALGYKIATLGQFPEKAARYEQLTASGVDIVPKHCFQKQLLASA
jgi:amino-acid N-acetyltransferase